MTEVQDAPETTEAETGPDPVAEAKERETATRAELKLAKTDARKAKTAFDNAEKAVEGKEGDELKEANAARKSAKQALDEANGKVEQLTAAVEQAAQATKDVRAQVQADKKAAKEAEKAKRAEERANRPKKAPLTLSQRRAVLKLAESPLRPTTDMNRTPLDYLVSVGLAQVTEVDHEVSETVKNPKAGEDGQPDTIEKTSTVKLGEYTLTDEGKTRAGELNPKWKTWKPAA